MRDSHPLDPWGVLASGTLLAGFSASTAGTACRNLNDDGFSATIIATATEGAGVRLPGGAELVRFERDELSRLSEA